MKRVLFAASVACLWACTATQAKAQSLESLSTLYNGRYQARIDQATAERQGLYDKYAKVIEGLRQKAQDAGDLEGVLALEREILMARGAEQVTKGALTIEGVATFRETLEKERAKINETAKADLDAIRSEYAAALNELVKTLTRLGQTQQALQARNLAMRVIGSLSGNGLEAAAMAAGLTPPPAPTSTVQAPPAGTPPIPLAANDLMSRHPISGEVALPPGQYTISGKLEIGDRKAKIPGETSTVAGTSIAGGSILVARGSWTSEDTLFVDTRVQSDLAWTVDARRSLFDNCEVGKGGAWGSGGKFASKSRFEACVFAKTFLAKWRVTATGIIANHCTFHDIVFPNIEFQEGVSEDAEEEWLTLRSCRFVDCVLPPEILLITEDCYFERCTFQPPAAPLDIHKTLRVTLHVHDCSPVPDLGDQVQWKVLEGQVAGTDKFGAPVPYKYFDKKLSF